MSLHFNVGCTVIKQLLFVKNRFIISQIKYIIIIKPIPKCLLYLAKIIYMYMDSVSPVPLTTSSLGYGDR